MDINCPANNEYCDTNMFLIYPQLDFSRYKIEIQLNIETSHLSLVDGISFRIRSQNPEFTRFLVTFRYVWLGISILSLIAYFWFYCRAGIKKMTFEHNFILILSISLVFFNDPIFGATLFKPSIAGAVLSTLFVTQFISLLIVFWIIMWRRMHLESVSISTNQIGLIPLFLGLLVFVLLSVAGCVASVYSRFEPGVHANTSYINKKSNSLSSVYILVNHSRNPVGDRYVLQQLCDLLEVE